MRKHDDTPEDPSSSASVLPGWASVTTRLLGKAGPHAWNFWDGAFEGDFAARLDEELAATGLLARLTPARTNGDVQMVKISKILAQQTLGSSDLEPTTIMPLQRGDKNVFVDRSYRQHGSFAGKHPYLARFIQNVEYTAAYHMRESMELDLSRTSVQVAEYPGDAQSGYPRHCDREEATCHENGEGDDQTSTNKESRRLLTILYYLTPDDWSVDQDGGCLRLHNTTKYTDVAPYANRIVVFRSDGVFHQVLPSLRRPRRAITLWLYGKAAPPKKSVVSTGTTDPGGFSNTPSRQEPSPELPPSLPLQLLTGKAAKATVFVSIAAYRDSETGPTLKNLMETAHAPDRVFVGLVLQLNMDDAYDCQVWEGLPIDQPWYSSHVRSLTLDAQHSTGPCPARALSQGLYRGEDYILMIDAHMRFRQNWDTYLVEELERCPSSKAMLTSYPTGYNLPNKIPIEIRGINLYPWKFDDDGMLRVYGRYFQTQPSAPVLHHLYAGGFSFARGSVVEECPYDGTLHHLFFGEEMSMACRLYCAGYDLYAPCQSVCYHLWSREHRPPPLSYMFDTRSRAQWRKHSLSIVQEQLAGTDRNNLSTNRSERSVEEFHKSVGINFSTRTILAQNKINLVGEPIGVDGIEEKLSPIAKSTIFSFL